MSLADDVVKGYRALSPDALLRFHERWLRATFADGIDVSALSVPRGNAKSAVTGRIVGLAMTPGSPLWRAGLETVVVAGSLRQARITWKFGLVLCWARMGTAGRTATNGSRLLTSRPGRSRSCCRRRPRKLWGCLSSG